MSFLKKNNLNLKNTDFTDDTHYDYQSYRLLIDTSVDNNSVTNKGKYTVTFTPQNNTQNQILINIGTLRNVVAVRLLGYSFPNSSDGILYNILSIDELRDNQLYSNVKEANGSFELLFSRDSETSISFSKPQTSSTTYHYYNPPLNKLSKMTITMNSYSENSGDLILNTSDHVLYFEIQTRTPYKKFII